MEGVQVSVRGVLVIYIKKVLFAHLVVDIRLITLIAMLVLGYI